MSNTTITCPNCNTQFEPTDALRDQLQKDLRKQMQEWKAQQIKELDLQKQALTIQKDKQEQELKAIFEVEKKQLAERIAKEQEAKIGDQYQHHIKHLNQANLDNEEKLKAAREKELELLKLTQELKTKEQEAELKMHKLLIEERTKLQEQLSKEEEEKSKLKEEAFMFKQKQLEQQLEQQKKLVDEMKRKAEQGSMQMQGEVQELMLETLLRQRFPFDQIDEIGKGVRGGDCVQIVRNQFGQECGKILYESKRTNAFSNDWVEKVKADMRSKSADIAVIVSQSLPKEISTFGQKEGVWICSFRDVEVLALILREQILKVHQVVQNSENKTDKMSLLYSYLTSNEFSQQWKAMQEGFLAMKTSIQRERDAMERLWKVREKQLEKVLLNATHIKASVDGISGTSAIDFDLIEGDDLLLLEE